MAREGRRPGLELPAGGRAGGLAERAREALAGVREIAALLDEADDGYVRSVDEQLAAVDEPERTPSAQILQQLRAEGSSFFELALETSRQQHRYFSELGQPAEKAAWLEEVARESLERQARLEADSQQSFEEYLREYFARV